LQDKAEEVNFTPAGCNEELAERAPDLDPSGLSSRAAVVAWLSARRPAETTLLSDGPSGFGAGCDPFIELLAMRRERGVVGAVFQLLTDSEALRFRAAGPWLGHWDLDVPSVHQLSDAAGFTDEQVGGGLVEPVHRAAARWRASGWSDSWWTATRWSSNWQGGGWHSSGSCGNRRRGWCDFWQGGSRGSSGS